MKVLIGRHPKGDTKRKVNIRIDKYDTWNMDHTLALLIVPMLIQLKDTKHGSPMVDDADVPEHLKSTAAPAKENEWDTDDNFHLRWDYVLDEMIWAMQQIIDDNAEDKFYDNSEVDENADIMQQINQTKVDMDGLKAHNARIQNGCRLFGVYFQALWD